MESTDRPNLLSLLRVGAAHVRVGRVFSIVLAGAALQIVTQVILANNLSKDEVGVISLLLGALPLLSTLSLLGQDTATVRFLSRDPERTYDAARHVRRVLAIVLPLGAALGLAGAGYYGLSGIVALAAVVLVVSQNALAVASAAQRARHRYELAMLGVWLPRIATAVLLIALLLASSISFRPVVLAIIAAFGATAIAFVARELVRSARGGTRVPTSVLRDGLFLFGLAVSFSVMTAMDKLVIGKMMSYADLAVYATIFAVMKGFDFIFYSVTHVLMPRVNAVVSIDLKRLNWSIAAVAAIVAAAYLSIGEEVIHRLYVGRYDQGAFLIAPFVLSGVMKLFYSVPSSIIGGRLTRTALKQFLWFNLAGMLVNIVLDIVLIALWGLLGAAVATAVAWALRLTGGYVILARHRKDLAAPPPGPAGEPPSTT